MARDGDRLVHALVQWGSIASHFDGTGRSCDVDPEEGSVPAATLAAILEHCPAEGDLTYAVWDGFGSWPERLDQFALMPGWGGRSYRLFVAEKGAFTQWPGMNPTWPQSANLIWPNDHSWCIATEIDWDSTLVACSHEVADALLADERLETFDVTYDDDLSWRGDTVNPRWNGSVDYDVGQERRHDDIYRRVFAAVGLGLSEVTFPGPCVHQRLRRPASRSKPDPAQ